MGCLFWSRSSGWGITDKYTTMPARSVPKIHIRRASDQVLLQQTLVREFSPGDIDLDDLTEAIRLLLEPAVEKIDSGRLGDPDLLSPWRRATHVVGAETP